MNRDLPGCRSAHRLIAAAVSGAAGVVFAISAMSAVTNSPALPHAERATFGGGCFWCLEAMFQTLPGVHAVTSGYAGGRTANPTYKEVCSGATGHAEVVQIEFDPTRISYDRLLDAFWDAHDPTTLNRQGGDVGTQYRSIILHHTDAQRVAAEKARAAAAGRFDKPIVTEIVPLVNFYPAEDYHQEYYEKNPRAGYCVTVVRPKLEKFKKSQQVK